MCHLDTPHKHSSENKWQNYTDKDWLAARTALHNGTSREEEKQGTLPDNNLESQYVVSPLVFLTATDADC